MHGTLRTHIIIFAHVMHPLVRLANASVVIDREYEACPIRKKVSDVSIRGCIDLRS